MPDGGLNITVSCSLWFKMLVTVTQNRNTDPILSAKPAGMGWDDIDTGCYLDAVSTGCTCLSHLITQVDMQLVHVLRIALLLRTIIMT